MIGDLLIIFIGSISYSSITELQNHPIHCTLILHCWRRAKIDHRYRLKIDQGAEPVFGVTGCG